MRGASSYVRGLARAHRYAGWLARTALLFRRPLQFLAHYVRQSSPVSRQVELRDGTRIRLSGHPHDTITLFVIFVREDYGRFPGARTVVDIGANLGAFALYAARQGAARVIAFEPNAAAFECMQRNVAENRMQERIRLRRFAVAAAAGQSVRFPKDPSVYNAIASHDAKGDFETVETVSLSSIVAHDAPQGIDLLKMDCEGAEYDILYAPDAPLERVREIRMEYHAGRGAELAEYLRGRGFRIDRLEADGPWTGMLWASRVA